jgi:hypothetical protein
MRIHPFTFLLVILFCSCGRTDNGVIINNTTDTIQLKIKLNYPSTAECPDNYLREQILRKEKSQNPEYKLAGDCFAIIDTTDNIASLKLGTNERLNLGTIRTGLSRDNYKTWEFNSISASSKDFELSANDKGIMTFVLKEIKWFATDNYYFVVGLNKK